VLLDQPDCFFVDRAAADADCRRCAEEIKDALPFAAAAAGLKNRGAFVSAAILRESEVRQDLFPLLLGR